MDEEERKAYLKSLYDRQSQESFNENLQKEIDYSDDWDYYRKQYEHDKDVLGNAADMNVDWRTKNELNRLGSSYTIDSQYNQENLWRKQGMGEQVGNASNRFLWNTIGDTVGGFASMIDLPGYIDPNKGVFRDFAETMRLQKEAVNKANPIYQKEGAGMTGPGMVAWWIENGSSLASSAASFVAQGAGVGAGIGKAMQGIKWLSSINKINKYDDLARRGKDLATGETLAGVGKTGDQIAAGLELGDKMRNLTSSVALTQSAAMMSATETYANVYQEALDSGYGEEYAKSVAGSAASNVVNLSRANILLNMTSANKFLGGSKNIKSLKPESFLPSWKNKTLGTAVKEGGQEALEENIELSAQKQAETLASDALSKGVESETIKGGAIPGIGLLTAPLLTGNVYGDATWKDITETTLLGAIGGIAQTGLTDLKNRIGSESSFFGATSRFGTQVEKKWDKNEYYSDGSIKAYQGDTQYETEDNTIKDKDGKEVLDYVYNADGSKAQVDGKDEVRQKIKTDASGQPIAKLESKKYSQKELDEKLYEEQVGRFKKFREASEKNAGVIATAKYQAQLDKTIGDLNDYVDLGKTGFDADKKAQLIDDLARIELVNKGTVDIDANPQLLIDEKAKVAKDLDNMSAKQIREKQDQLLNFSLSRTAIESFENGTKEPLIEMLKEMRDVSPEKAKELGYDENYKQKAQEAIDQVNKDFDRWMEFNTKRPGNIARALFKNRKQHDYLSQKVDALNKEAQAEHDNAFKQHTAQNDVDLYAIEDKNGEIRSVKSKYDEAFKIEQEKVKTQLADKELKQLKAEEDKLKAELDELNNTTSEVVDKDPKAFVAKLRAKESEIKANRNAIEERQDDLAKAYDDRIKALGIGKSNNSKALEIYKAKLKAVEEARELDKIFDELTSEKGLARLAKLERDKNMAAYKQRAFLSYMRDLSELQKAGGKIYWGSEGIAGKVSESNGVWSFNTYEIKPFEMFANMQITLNGETMSMREYYETRVRPDKEKEWKKYKAEFRKTNKEALLTAKSELYFSKKELEDKTARNKQLADGIISLNDIESPGYEVRVKEDAANPAAKQVRIDRINRLNKLLGLPTVNDTLSAKDIMNTERSLSTKLTKAQDDLTALNDKIKALDSEVLTRKDVKKIAVPNELRLYSVIDVEGKDGVIEVRQAFTGGANVPLNFDLLNRMKGLTKDEAAVQDALDQYMKLYAKQMIRINDVATGKNTEFTSKKKLRTAAKDEHDKLVDEFKVIRDLLDFIQANQLNSLAVDHTNPFVNQFNSIVAAFRTGTREVFNQEEKALYDQINSFREDIIQATLDIKEIDDEIDRVQRDILARKAIISTSKGRSLGGHKTWLKQLNKTLAKAQSTKVNLVETIDNNTRLVSKWENYIKLLNANRGDINFVNNRLNDLAVDLELMTEDLNKINDSIDGANEQVDHLTERIAYTKKLQDEILKALNIRDRHRQIQANIDSLYNSIYEEIARLSRGFDNDPEFIKYIKKVAYDAMFKGKMDLEYARTKMANMGLDSNSDLNRLINSLEVLYNEQSYLVDNANFKANMTDVQLQQEFEQLQLMLAEDLEQQEVLDQLLGDSEKRKTEMLGKIEQVNSIKAETYHILGNLNRKLGENFSKVSADANTLMDNAVAKIKEIEVKAKDLAKSITQSDDELFQLRDELTALMEIRGTIEDQYDQFSKESEIEVMNEMIRSISGTVDKNGKNKMITDLESQIALIDAETRANSIELLHLDNIVNLRREFVAMLMSNDFKMTDLSLNQRREIIRQMSNLDFTRGLNNDELFELYKAGFIPKEQLRGSEEEITSRILQYQNEQQAKATERVKSISKERDQMDTELDMLRLIFEFTQPTVAKAAEEAVIDKEIKETVDERIGNEELSEGGDPLEDNPELLVEESDKKWQASKPNIFTVVPRDLEWNKADKKPYYADGVPVISNNFNEVHHMNFLNSFALNPNDLINNHQVELVQLTKFDSDGKTKVVRNVNEPLNSIAIFDSRTPGKNPSALDADINSNDKDTGLPNPPGLYAVITNKKGHRAHINDAGDIMYIPVGESVPNGYNLIFNTIPRPKIKDNGYVHEDSVERMGSNMLLNYLSEITGKQGSEYAEFADQNGILFIGDKMFNLSPQAKTNAAINQQALEAELRKQIAQRMISFRKGVDSEMDKSTGPIYFSMSDLSKGSLLKYENGVKKDAAWLFSPETFLQLVVTDKGKGLQDIKIGIEGSTTYKIESGVAHIVTNDGAVVPIYSKPNNDTDVSLILKLITDVVGEDGKWNKKGSYPIDKQVGSNVEFNLVSGSGLAEVGLLNRLINWGENKKGNVAQPFSIWIKRGKLHFVKQNGSEVIIPMKTVREIVAGTSLTDSKGEFHRGELNDFLKMKRKHIHFKLAAKDNLNNKSNPYYHPTLIDKKVVMVKFNTYQEYLSEITQTDVVNPTDYKAKGFKTPMVGKYYQFSPVSMDEKVFNDDISLNGVYIKDGTKLVNKNTKESHIVVNVGGTLKLNGEAVTNDSILDYEFETIKPEPPVTKTVKTETKVIDGNKVDIKTDVKPALAELSKTFMPVLGPTDKLVWSNTSISAPDPKTKQQIIGDKYSKITTVKLDDSNYYIEQSLSVENEGKLSTYYDYYKVTKDGKVESINDYIQTEIIDKGELKGWRGLFDDKAAADQEVFKFGSELAKLKDPNNVSEFFKGEGVSLNKTGINNINDYIDYSLFGFDINSAADKQYNMFKAGRTFIDKYIPFLATGSQEFSKDLLIKTVKDPISGVNDFVITDRNTVGEVEKHIILFNTPNRPTNLKELLEDKEFNPTSNNNIFYKLIDNLNPDGLDKVKIEYIPHLNFEGQYIKGTNTIQLAMGSIVESGMSGKNMLALVAHEFIHHLDMSKPIKVGDDRTHMDRLISIRNAVFKQAKTNLDIQSKELSGKDGKVSALAYWLFNKQIDTNEFNTILANTDNIEELYNKLGIDSEADSMLEFFSNVLNKSDLQEFLDSIPAANLGLDFKVKKSGTLWDAFKSFLSDLLAAFDIKGGVTEDSSLELILTTGAAHYSTRGGFKQMKADTKKEFSELFEDVKSDETKTEPEESAVGEEVVTEKEPEEVIEYSGKPDLKPVETTDEIVAVSSGLSKKKRSTSEIDILKESIVNKIRSIPEGDEREFTGTSYSTVTNKIRNQYSLDELKDLDKLNINDLADALRGLDDVPFSLMSLLPADGHSIDRNKLINSYEAGEYINAIEQLLPTVEYTKFINDLGKLKKSEAPTISLNQFLENLMNDLDTTPFEPVFVKLREYVETNSQPSKEEQMNEAIRKLSSTYDFKGENLTQVELDSVMSAMTHYTFENLRGMDAEVFFDANINSNDTYNEIRRNMKTQLEQIREVIDEAMDEDSDKDVFEFYKKRSTGGYKIGLQIITDLQMVEDDMNFIAAKKNRSASDDKLYNDRKRQRNLLLKKVEDMDRMYDKFLASDEDSMKRFEELIRLHSQQMIAMGFEYNENILDEIKITDEVNATKNMSFEMDSSEIDQRTVMFPAIKLLVAAQVNHVKNEELSKQLGQEIYELKTNYLGFPEPNNFNDTYNLLVDTLSNLPADRGVLMGALTEAFKGEVDNPMGKVLYGLANEDSILNKLTKGGVVNYDISQSDARLIVQFIQTFSKFKPKFLVSWYDGNGSIRHIDANVDRISEIILGKWNDSFKATLIEKDGSFVFNQTNAEGFGKAVEAAQKEFKDGRDPKLSKLNVAFKSIGIDIANTAMVKLNKAFSVKDGVLNKNIFDTLLAQNSLADAIVNNAANPNYNPFKDLSIKGTLKTLAENVAMSSNQTSDNQYMWNNTTNFSITLNNMLSTTANKINHSAANGTMRSEVPHLFNVYNKNSVLRNMLEKQEITLEVGISKGLTSNGQNDIDQKELDSPDKWAMFISQTMNNRYTFFRSADRGTENIFGFVTKTGAYHKLYSTGGKGVTDNGIDAFYGYLLDEVNAMVGHANGLGKNLKFYDKFGSEFRFFSDDKISPAIKSKIKDMIGKKQSYDDIKNYLESIKPEITESILKYFKREAVRLKAELQDNDLLENVPRDKTFVKVYNATTNKMEEQPVENANAMRYIGISPDILKPYLDSNWSPEFDTNGIVTAKSEAVYDKALMDLLTEFNVLQYGAYVEQTKLLVGDPAMYKNSDDFFKRMSMQNSTKKVSVVDKTLDKVYNAKNNVELYLGDKKIDFTFKPDQLKDLIRNKYKLENINEATQKLITDAANVKDITSIEIKPMWGFHPDKILSNTEYNGYFTSIITETVMGTSVLATDKVDEIDIVDGKVVYYSVDESGKKTALKSDVKTKKGEVPNVSVLRKLFTEAFIKDGITNVSKLSNKVKSYLKPYLEMEESNAQAWVTLPGYKEILLRAGDWTLKHDKIYVKMLLGKEVSSNELTYFRVLKTQYAGPMALDNSNNGELKNGDKVNGDKEDSNLYIPTGYKHSVFPLIPQVIKGTVLEKMNELMTSKGISLHQDGEANKFGRLVREKGEVNEGKANIVYDKEGRFILNTQDIITQNNSFEYFGVQLDQAPKMKGKISTSTQFRKLALSNMLEFGVPADYLESEIARLSSMGSNTGRKLNEIRDLARANWNQLTPSDKLSKSEMFKLYDEYQNIQRQLFDAPFKQLAKELDLYATEENGKIVSYEIGNRKKLVEILLEANKDVSTNVKKSIESLLDPDTVIEQVLTKDKLESVMFAIVNSRVLKEKRKGEGSPQVSVSFLENYSIDGVAIERAGVNGNRFSHPSLRHYVVGKDGKTLPSHCMIGLPLELREWARNKFGEGIGKENYLERLNVYLDALHAKLDAKEIEGKPITLTDEEKNMMNIITMIGFRIPNQGLQSAEFMRVRKFLPTEVGDSIVVASEIVAKAGSDFDIDKLNVYRTNYTKTESKEGEVVNIVDPIYVKYMDDSNSKVEERYKLMKNKGDMTESEFARLPITQQNSKEALQNRMIEVQHEIMSLPYNYRQLMSPISDVITKRQAWNIRMLNTPEGIERLQTSIKVFDKNKKEFVATDDIGLQEARYNELWKLLKDNSNIKSVILSPTEFVPGSNITVTPAEFDDKGNLVKHGKLMNGPKEIDTQQVNLTDEAALAFTLNMAPIYAKAQDRWIDERDSEMKNKTLADIARPLVNINKFIEFLSGKAGVGQTAVHITHHQLAMAANLSLNTKNSYWVFPHTLIDGQPSFANKLDKDGEWISETLSAFVNAYVDIAKDPYVYDMNAGNRTANMMLMMVRAGASVPWITKFISQPIIKDYLKAQRNNESMFKKIFDIEKSKGTIVAETLKKYNIEVAEKDKLIYQVNEGVDGVIEDELFINYNKTKDGAYKAAAQKAYDDATAANAARWGNIEKLMENGMFSEERLGEYILFDAGKKLAKDKLIAEDPNHSYLKVFDEKLDEILTMTNGMIRSTMLANNPNIYNNIQGHILDLFLEYQRQSKDFQAMIRATSADTKMAQKNMVDNEEFFRNVELVKFKDRFTNLDYIYNNSVVSEAHKIMEETVKVFKPLYMFKHNARINRTFEDLKDIYSNLRLGKDKTVKVPGTMANDFATALVTSDLIDDRYSPRTVFNELFIIHPSNTYIDSKGNKAPLATIIFEMNSNTTNLLKIEDNWIKNGSNPETKPSILDLRALFEGDKNKILSELRGTKSARFAKDYDEFSNKIEMISNEPAFSSISFNLRRTTPAQEDVFRNQLIAIKEVSPKLYYDLIKVVINQYGIHHTTSDSFSKFIPEEDTRKIMRDKYDAFNRLTDADQIRLLNQFKDQFMQRSIQFTPDVKKTKKTTKAGVEYAVREDDGKSKLPHLIMTSKNADGKMVTTFIKPTRDEYTKDGKTYVNYRYSDRAGEYNRYPKVYSDVGSKAVIRGHGRFFLGYDLSLNDKNSGISKQSGIIFNDNQGEINMMMNEVNEIRSGINFQEEQSSGYAERTKKNASADATIHLGIDFTTAGEKLTKSSVQNQGKQYISLDVNNFSITPERVDKIVDMLNSVNAKTLNIAGNGIYTMKGKYTQQQVDDFTYDLLNQVLNSPNLTNKIVSIRSGGQTGFDEAGAKAGIKLGIPTLVLAPKGWVFRDVNGKDISNKQQFMDRFDSVKPTINQPVSQVDKSSKHSFTHNGITIPTGFKLGAQQEKALINLINFVQSPIDKVHVLEGSAGTGKTSIIGLLDNYLKATKRSHYKSIYFAPTHAATAQLAISTSVLGNKDLPSTIQSGVTLDMNNNPVFTAKVRELYTGWTPLVIVDESSMLDDTDTDQLIKATEKSDGKVIFMGDADQLPKVDTTNPKNKIISKIFTDFTGSVLTEVFRQKEGPLLDLLNYTKSSTTFDPHKVANHSTVKFQSKSEFDKRLLENTKNDLENTSVLTYSNDSVANYNRSIRQNLGKGVLTEPGDVIMGYIGYQNKQIDKGHLANSLKYNLTGFKKRGSVIEMELTSQVLSKLKKLGFGVDADITANYYQLSSNDTLKFDLTDSELDSNNELVSDIFRQLFVLFSQFHDSKGKLISKSGYRQYLEEKAIITKPLSNVNLGNDYIYVPDKNKMVRYDDSNSDHRFWKSKGFHIEKGADYGYAMTIHKSQGLTIPNVHYDLTSVQHDRGGQVRKDTPILRDGVQVNSEKNALHYVAMSRASNELNVMSEGMNLPILDTGNSGSDMKFNPDILYSLSSADQSKMDNKAKKDAEEALNKAKKDQCNL